MIGNGIGLIVIIVLSVVSVLCAGALVFLFVRYTKETKLKIALKKENALLNERMESMSSNSSVKIQIFARLSQLLASSFMRTYLFKQIISVLTHYYPQNAMCAVLKDEDDKPVVIDMHSDEDGRTVQNVSFDQIIRIFSGIQEQGGAKTAYPILDDVLLPQSLTNYIYPFALLTEEKIQGYLVVSQKSPIAPGEHLFFTDTATFLSSALQNVKTTNERDFINEQFGRSVDEKVRDYLLTHSDGGSIQSVSVMFFDIRNFTTLSEKLGPVASVKLLNELFSRCDEIIRSEDGFINKFTGDGFMAVFGAPIPSDDHPVKAVRAALKILSGTDLNVGIGIASGDALAGTIGSEQRKEYTVIGDTVNTASRVEGLCKVFGSSLVVTKQTYEPYSRYLEEAARTAEPLAQSADASLSGAGTLLNTADASLSGAGTLLNTEDASLSGADAAEEAVNATNAADAPSTGAGTLLNTKDASLSGAEAADEAVNATNAADAPSTGAGITDAAPLPPAQTAAQSADAALPAREKRGLLHKAQDANTNTNDTERTDAAPAQNGNAPTTKATAQTRFLGTIRLKGKLDHVDVYDLASRDACYTADFKAALDAYYAKDFSRAKELLNTLQSAYPNDKAVSWYAAKCAARSVDQTEWDGVEQMTEK